MYERALRQMRDRIHTRKYVMTIHAEEEMSDEGLSAFDIERVILTGSIIERQKDYQTDEWKYVIIGQTTTGEKANAVGKISITDKLVIITVYREI